MTSEIVFTIPNIDWLTSNQRLHWTQKAQRVRTLRHLAAVKARAEHLPKLERAKIVAHIQYATQTDKP